MVRPRRIVGWWQVRRAALFLASIVSSCAALVLLSGQGYPDHLRVHSRAIQVQIRAAEQSPAPGAGGSESTGRGFPAAEADRMIDTLIRHAETQASLATWIGAILLGTSIVGFVVWASMPHESTHDAPESVD